MNHLLLVVIGVDSRYLPSLQKAAVEGLTSGGDEAPVLHWEIPDHALQSASEHESLREVVISLLEAMTQKLIHADDDALQVTILMGELAPAETIIALAEVIEMQANFLPVVVAVEGDPRTLLVTRVDPVQLPLRLRLMQGDFAVVTVDTWTSREMRDAGEPPDRPRGNQIRIVYRRIEEAEEFADCFVGMYESESGPVVLIHPWSAVAAVSDWNALSEEQRAAEIRTAIAHLQFLSCFYWRYGPCFLVEIDDPHRPSLEQKKSSTDPSVRALPFFRGYTVDERLRQFRTPTLTEIFSFDSPRGQQFLREMQQQGLSTASVPLDSPEGQRHCLSMQQALQDAASHDTDEEDRTP